MRTLHLARVALSLSARAATPLGAPIFFGILLVACIIFGPTGMRPAELVFTLRTSPIFAVTLWFGWIVLLFPVARLALFPPSSLYLRWLPGSRLVLYAAAAFATFVVELPWVILFAAGEGILSGLAAGFGAVAVHAAWASRPWGFMHVFVVLGWALAAFVPIPLVAFALAVLTSAGAIKQAIDRAPEVHALARRGTRVHVPEVALALAHVTYVLRKEPATLGRMLVLAGLAGLILPLAARGHDLETPASYGGLALGLSAVVLSPAMSGMAAAVIRSERLTAWLADVAGTSGRTRVRAAALAAAGCGVCAGVFLGLVAVAGQHARDGAIVARLFLIPALWAAMVGTMATALVREADASPKRSDRGMLVPLIAVIVGIVSSSLWGEKALGLLIGLALASLAFAPQRWERLRRQRGVS